MSNDETNRTGDAGVGLAKWFFSSLGAIFREQYNADKGIDAQVELVNPKTKDRHLIALQIKSGKSYFQYETIKGFKFYFGERLYKYWTSYSIPVLILLVDDPQHIYWEHLNKSKIRKTKKEYVIEVPKANILSEKTMDTLIKISDRPQYIKNLDYLRLNIPLIKAAKEKKVVLESTEWVNKSSGRGTTCLKIYNGEELEQTIDWKYWFPFQLYRDVFRRLFPWASFTIDDEFYMEYDKKEYMESCHRYDWQKDEWVHSNLSFEEYRASLPDIRYVLRAGEVGFYKLNLTPNKLGESILELNEYLENGKPYEGVKGEPIE